MEILKETLMEGARNSGICAEGYGKMRGYDRDEMIQYYLANPDWCLERNFPSMRLLRREFSDIEDKGVYVDNTFDGGLMSEHQVYVFHHCKGKIKVAMDYEGAVIPMLYFANGCKMEVVCEQWNMPPITVPLYILDDGKTEIEATDSEGCNFVRYSIKKVQKTRKVTE